MDGDHRGAFDTIQRWARGSQSIPLFEPPQMLQQELSQ